MYRASAPAASPHSPVQCAMLLLVVSVWGWPGPRTRSRSGSSAVNRTSAPALPRQDRDVVPSGQDLGVVGALEVLTKGEFLPGVAESLGVVPEFAVGVGEGGVQVEPVFPGGGGGGVELGLAEGDLQPDVGVRAVHDVQDAQGRLLAAAVAAGQQGASSCQVRSGSPARPTWKASSSRHWSPAWPRTGRFPSSAATSAARVAFDP